MKKSGIGNREKAKLSGTKRDIGTAQSTDTVNGVHGSPTGPEQPASKKRRTSEKPSRRTREKETDLGADALKDTADPSNEAVEEGSPLTMQENANSSRGSRDLGERPAQSSPAPPTKLLPTPSQPPQTKDAASQFGPGEEVLARTNGVLDHHRHRTSKKDTQTLATLFQVSSWDSSKEATLRSLVQNFHGATARGMGSTFTPNEDFDQDLLCAICHGSFNHPVQVCQSGQNSCGHIFCKGCIDESIRIQKIRGIDFPCPMCHREMKSLRVIPNNNKVSVAADAVLGSSGSLQGHVTMREFRVHQMGQPAHLCLEAISAGNLPALRFLVEECGADVQYADEHKNTLLHRAVSVDDCPALLLEWLLEKGVDPNVEGDQGTPGELALGAKSPAFEVFLSFCQRKGLVLKLGAQAVYDVLGRGSNVSDATRAQRFAVVANLPNIKGVMPDGTPISLLDYAVAASPNSLGPRTLLVLMNAGCGGCLFRSVLNAQEHNRLEPSPPLTIDDREVHLLHVWRVVAIWTPVLMVTWLFGSETSEEDNLRYLWLCSRLLLAWRFFARPRSIQELLRVPRKLDFRRVALSWQAFDFTTALIAFMVLSVVSLMRWLLAALSFLLVRGAAAIYCYQMNEQSAPFASSVYAPWARALLLILVFAQFRRLGLLVSLSLIVGPQMIGVSTLQALAQML